MLELVYIGYRSKGVTQHIHELRKITLPETNSFASYNPPTLFLAYIHTYLPTKVRVTRRTAQMHHTRLIFEILFKMQAAAASHSPYYYRVSRVLRGGNGNAKISGALWVCLCCVSLCPEQATKNAFCWATLCDDASRNSTWDSSAKRTITRRNGRWHLKAQMKEVGGWLVA